MTDLNEIVQQAQCGDSDAYEQIVRRFQDMAVGYAYSMLGDMHQAEDTAQDAFSHSLLRPARFTDSGGLSGLVPTYRPDAD